MMLSTTKHNFSIFSEDTSLANIIDIHLEDPEDPTSLCDTNDTCLKAVVRAYDAGVIQSTSAFHLSGPQVIVWLNDLSKIQIRINTPSDGTIIPPEHAYDKETILVKCAMQSILRKLVAQDLIEKENLVFQVRSSGGLGGPMFLMRLNPDKNNNTARFCANGFISNTFAYLDDNHMSIFLNRNLLMDGQKTKTIRDAVAAITGTVTQPPAAEEDDRKQLQIPGRR